MKLSVWGLAAVLSFVCGLASAQQPGVKMYPGTDFPGNDFGQIASPTPEDCASRCLGDGRCQAFTFNIAGRTCYLKSSASRFEGSTNAVSGVVEGRPGMLPGYAPSPYPPGVAAPPSCRAQGNEVCSGCSVSCQPGQQASCREGEVRGTTCWTRSQCLCEGAGAAPPSVYTPVSPGSPEGNSCSTPDRFACRGCSASCRADESAICSPSIPGDNNTCNSQAFCRCQKK
jgi:hypothetical protein